MSFIAPEWDNDALGDQTHTNLFQKNKFKTFSKQKSKKNKGITSKNNDAKLLKQNDDNVSGSNQKKLKKKLKRLNPDKIQQPSKLEVNNVKQVKKKTKVKNTINDSDNKKQKANGLLSKPKSPKSEKGFEQKQIKKNLKKQKEKGVNTKQNISLGNGTDKNKTKDDTIKNMSKHDKNKLKKQKLQIANTDMDENYEMQNASSKIKTKQPDNPEKRERKRLKKKLKRLQKQNDKCNYSKKQMNTKLGMNIEVLKKTLEQHGNTKSKAKNSTNSLREKMQDKLKAARFRFLNEQMYTNEGKDAQKLFKSDPAAFTAYHDGYRQQIARWPLNPLDTIINRVKKLSKEYVVADFGCGDARLSKSVAQKVHSFDLVANDPSVTACDMAHVPLKNNSVDVTVFCLSLMGTNLKDYLFEANRVLKPGGILLVAEVESRFEQVDVFIEGLHRYGFVNTWKDLSHNLFYFLEFEKERDIKYKNKLPTISLHPCLYKKR